MFSGDALAYRLLSADTFYNNSPLVLQTLASQGCGFVCKNKDEMRKVVEAEVDRDIIRFASPDHLVSSHLKFAAANDIRLVSFQSEADLRKIKKSAELSRFVGYRCEGPITFMSRQGVTSFFCV